MGGEMHWLLRLGAWGIALASAPSPELQRFEAVEPHMGTLVRITVYTTGEQGARDAFRAGFQRIADLDATLSDYKPDSELNRLSTAAVGHATAVSQDLFRVLAASQELAEATGGAFDVTQGPLIRLWREARTTRRVPDASALEEAASRGGFRKMHLDAARRTVRLDVAGMQLDVGAIGKGFAASEALAAVTRLGVRRALVAVSGDLAFSDAPPGQRGWRVRVASDDPPPAGVPAYLELTHAAVSTAGSSEQHVDIDGRRYSHIIDPASRLGLVDDITVTVIATHGLEADGLDTAVSVLGVEKGLALIESRPTAAAVIIRRTAEGPTAILSTRFRQLLPTP
ncbi:MAG: FAD:protein FMN transferase [Acidobacteriota bacterium]